MKKIIPLVVVIAALAVAAVVWFVVTNKPAGYAPSANVPLSGPGSAEAPADNTQAGLGGQVFGQVSQNSVAGNIPQTNPFAAGTGANPYTSSYTNPFGQ
jgi:hypothetical protein